MGKFDGLGDFLREALSDEERDAALDMLASAGIQTKGIKTGTPEYLKLMTETDWSEVTATIEKARGEQLERSKAFKIGVKEGSLPRPSDCAELPDDVWGDPVNNAFLLADKASATKSLEDWNKLKDAYPEEERKIIGTRIRFAVKSFEGNPEDFASAEAREKHAGITIKSFSNEVDDDTRFEPTAYADFTNYNFRIDSADALAQSRVEWAACKKFSPDVYDENETKLIDKAFEYAEAKFVSKAKPTMIDCPHCDKPVPEGTKECPHCGKAMNDGDAEDQQDGGSDEATEDAKKAFAAEVQRVASALIAAYDSGERDAVVDATKDAVLVSHQVAARQKDIKLTEVQGILEHALHMGGVCPNCDLTAPRGATKGLGTNNDLATLQRERDELAAALEKAKAAGDTGSALKAAKETAEEAEQDADMMRLRLKSAEEANALLADEIQKQHTTIDQLRRYAPRPVSRKSVSVGTPGTMPRTTVAEVEVPPQTFYEMQRKRGTNGR